MGNASEWNSWYVLNDRQDFTKKLVVKVLFSQGFQCLSPGLWPSAVFANSYSGFEMERTGTMPKTFLSNLDVIEKSLLSLYQPREGSVRP